MPNLVFRILLFLSSYFPLFIIFGIRNWERYFHVALTFFVVAGISLLALFLYFWKAKTIAGSQVKVVEVHSKDAEVMSYIVTYIIPFLDLPLDDWKKGGSLLIFFAVIGLIYVNSNLIHINPILNIMQYHVFEIESETGTFSLITKRRRLSKGRILVVSKLGDEILLEGPV